MPRDRSRTCRRIGSTVRQSLPGGVPSKILVAAGAVRQKSDVEVAVLGHVGPRGPLVEGVLVQRHFDWVVEVRDAKLRLELAERRGKLDEVVTLPGWGDVDVTSDVGRPAQLGGEATDHHVTNFVTLEYFEHDVRAVRSEISHG